MIGVRRPLSLRFMPIDVSMGAAALQIVRENKPEVSTKNAALRTEIRHYARTRFDYSLVCQHYVAGVFSPCVVLALSG
jgi:hypothetical protein